MLAVYCLIERFLFKQQEQMLNISNSSQESMARESNSEPVLTFPPIADPLSRFFAWFIDFLLLGVVWKIIDWMTYLPLGIGRYAYLAGFLCAIAYFGIMNSKIARGQTVGKRLLKIAVRDKNNEPIGLGRSTIRILILAMPFMFEDWPWLMVESRGMAFLLSMLIFGLVGAFLYTMIFNQSARQGIHDLIVRTYVVHLPGKPIRSFPTTPPIHYRVAVLWIGFVAMVSLAILLIGSPLLEFWWANRPLSYDCLALREDSSVIAYSNTTHTAYRSNDGGLTWSRDTTVDEESKPECIWNWPITLDTEPPAVFYYMKDLGIYQSIDNGETLTSVPFEPGKATPYAVATPSKTLIVAVGGGDFWIRLPGGDWIRYREKHRTLLLEPAPE